MAVKRYGVPARNAIGKAYKNFLAYSYCIISSNSPKSRGL
jgi:hypothetical protein